MICYGHTFSLFSCYCYHWEGLSRFPQCHGLLLEGYRSKILRWAVQNVIMLLYQTCFNWRFSFFPFFRASFGAKHTTVQATSEATFHSSFPHVFHPFSTAFVGLALATILHSFGISFCNTKIHSYKCLKTKKIVLLLFFRCLGAPLSREIKSCESNGYAHLHAFAVLNEHDQCLNDWTWCLGDSDDLAFRVFLSSPTCASPSGF